MNGSLTRGWVFGIVLASAAPGFAQSVPSGFAQSVPSGFAVLPAAAKMAVPQQGELHGVIHDERGQPLQGAIISASVLGASSVLALSDREGRYSFRSLRPGSFNRQLMDAAAGMLPPDVELVNFKYSVTTSCVSCTYELRTDATAAKR